MNKVFPLIAALLISALSYPEPISVEESDRVNAKPGSISFIPIDDPDNPSSSSSSSLAQIDLDIFNCDRYGPFSVGGANFDVAFNYTLYSVDNQTIVERLRLLNKNNSVLSSISKPAKNYTKGTSTNVTFTVPIKDYLTTDGLTLNFEIINSGTYTVLKRYSSTFYPVINEVISYSILKYSTYTSRSFGFRGNGENMENTSETFDFRTTGEYLNVDYYYELDFSNNYFKYPNTYTISYKSITLRFNDSDNQFPYLTHQNNGNILLPLSLYKKDDKVMFTFKNNFYVHKKTLRISDAYRQNYVLTNRFFLPINGMSKFNGKMLYIDIEGLGQSGLSTTIPLRYIASKSLVGNSRDGENYVVGGNK